MSDQENQVVEQTPDILNMSDEELKNFDPSTLTAPQLEENPVEPPKEEPKEEELSDPVDPVVPDTPKEDTELPKPDEVNAVDYKAFYEQMTKPFKANGKEVKVQNVEDAITLMQMGANYSKKMAALKPNIKAMKMLEANGLLDEGKLAYLIDLDKRNPDAIAKLIKEAGVDPLEIDTSKADTYTPTTKPIDPRELALDEVLESIQHTPQYQQTVDAVGNKWDETSKQTIANNPAILKVINEHMGNGIYSIINDEMENARMLGRLNGMSDLEAYKFIGDSIQARGGFNHIGNGSTVNKAPVTSNVITKQAEDAKRNERRRAASPSKPVVNGRNLKDFDPLSMSDEDFAKASKQFYNLRGN